MEAKVLASADMIAFHTRWGRMNMAVLFIGAAHLSCSRKEAQAEASVLSLSASSKATVAPPAPTQAPALLGPVSPKTESACADICEHSRRLRCEHVDECKPQCIAMGSFTPCQDQFAAFYRCLAGKPDRNWECGDDGVAAIREGLCDDEQKNAVGCMEAKMQQP
jgi:hypothetical protein